MGAFASVDLRPEEIREIEDITAFEPKEIKTLYKRFRRLDRGGRGTISSDDLMMIPEVAMNPLSSRLVSQLFERDPDDRINFKSFVMGLSVFSERARPEVRKRVVFRLYDLDGDGMISPSDLRKLMETMVGKAMSPATMDAVIETTMAEADCDRDGKISYDDFERSLGNVAWDLFTVPVKSSSKFAQIQG